MKLRAGFLVIVALFGLMMLVVACGDDEEAAPASKAPTAAATEAPKAKLPATQAPTEVKHGGTLRTVSQSSIKSLDRIWTTAFVTHVTTSHLHESLLTWDNDDQVQPLMVGEWSVSSDNLTYSFSLRDGQTFHNGAAVTTDDVIASINRWKEKSSHAGMLFKRVESLTKVDDKTFELKLTEPYGLVLAAFGDPIANFLPVIPASLAATAPDENVTDTTGSGPYKVATWEPGNRLVLTRFEGYKPRSEPGSFLAGARISYVDNIEYLEIPDIATKISGLETKQWDFVDGAGQDFFDKLDGNPDLDVHLHKPGHEPLIVFNKQRAPFDNVKARQAVQAGVDVGAIMATYGDAKLWQTCPAVFYCGGKWESNASADKYNQNDIELGKKLLAESGWDTSKPILLMSPTDYATIYPIGQIGKIGMEAIGFKVDFPAMDWATLVQKRGDKEQYDIFTTWGAYWCCFDPIVSSVYTSKWYGWYESPRMEALKDKFIAALTAEEKQSIIDDVQHLVYEEVPFVHVGQFYSFDAGGKQIKDYQGKHYPIYWGAWLDR
jgi:peptide/nickel transport system substrate-binding protein